MEMSEADNSAPPTQVKKTQKNIKFVLTERFYAWENARVAAMDDPEVNLYADPDKGEPAYLPKPQMEEVRGRVMLILLGANSMQDIPDAVGSDGEQIERQGQMPLPDGIKPGSEARI